MVLCRILIKFIIFQTKADPEMGSLGSREMKKQRAVTKAEIYTRRLMCFDAGLPCWYPEPLPPAGETGIVPGDVGTFNPTNGFIKMFNLWEDGFAAQYGLPPMETTVHSNIFEQGRTLASGMNSRTCQSNDGR
jgi:hypothetical protein